MNTIYIMALEPIDTRYTGEWFTELPKMIQSKIAETKANYQVQNVNGYGMFYSSEVTTPGAFLNFGATNIWKNHQMNNVAHMFNSGVIKPGDKFLFTDAWHTGIIQLKYMSELLNIPIEIHSIWHAGSYDPQDFLGRLVKDKQWSYNIERALFYASDYNYFATNFHIDMFAKALQMHDRGELYEPKKFVRTGLPFSYLSSKLGIYKAVQKEDIILFPHRIAPEKQLEIFKDLENQLPKYKFIVCQETKLTKDEYHVLLGKAKMVFSANLQETLGISMYEGMCANALPLVPDRLSYKEMYSAGFKYPSEWTESYKSYLKHRDKLVKHIEFMMENYYRYELAGHTKEIGDTFFTPNELLNKLVA